jgi:hypothetical protein
MAEDLDFIHDLIGADEIDEALESDPEVAEAVLELAEAAAEYWRSIAPVGDAHDPNAGKYRDSIRVEVDENSSLKSGNQVYVLTDDPIANLIEYGSAHNPEFACRARTEDQFSGTEIVAAKSRSGKPTKTSLAAIARSRTAARSINEGIE